MKALPIQWSESKQDRLSSQVVGYWAQDIWKLGDCPIDDDCREYSWGKGIYFICKDSFLNTEIKYACWQKLEKKEWKTKTLWSKTSDIKLMGQWLNAIHKDLSSLIERDMKALEVSFRSYLVNAGHWKNRTQTKLNRRQQKSKAYSWSSELNTFRQVYKTLEKFYDDRDEYNKLIWDVRNLGCKVNASKSSYTISFKKITQAWLLDASKQYIRYSLTLFSLGECQSRIGVLNHFSTFLRKNHPSLKPESIDRAMALDFLTYISVLGFSAVYKHRQITSLRDFLEISGREKWAPIPERRFFYQEDFPKIGKRKPRFIPNEVLGQLNMNLDDLQPHIRRMVLILQECGMRISELCAMPFNCLSQDTQGDFFLKYVQFKMDKEHCIPISREIAAVIQEQQQVTRKRCGEFPYLFPAPTQWEKVEPIKQQTFSRALNQLAVDKNICDNSGTLWRFQSHQFRHTLGTTMINSGVPQHIIQRYLGHESPEMTATYAHIHDQTLKREFEKFKSKVVDVTGKTIISKDLPVESVDYQWFKQNVLAQSLPNGSCALPVVAGECPHANACLTCGHFRTDKSHLDKHKAQLQETNRVIQIAEANNWNRQAEMNRRVKTNLESIIEALEEKADGTAD